MTRNVTVYKAYEYFTITPQGHCLLNQIQVNMDVEVPKMDFKGQVMTRSLCQDHWKYIPAQ
jgi:hypothetical protein